MDINDMINDIEKQRLELEAVQQKFLTQNQETFKEIAKKFFAAVPEVKVIGWTQYTPYFNDGETCEFSVNDVYFVIEDVDIDEVYNGHELEDYEYIPFPYYGNKSYEEFLGESKAYADKSTNNWYVEKVKVLESIGASTFEMALQLKNLISKNEQLMLSTFGDHVSVFITPEEIVVNEYEHE